MDNNIDKNENTIPKNISIKKQNSKTNKKFVVVSKTSLRSQKSISKSSIKSSSKEKRNSHEKKEEYRVISKNSLLKDIKNTAINGINQVCQRFNSFGSMLIKPSNKSKTNLENYQQITNLPTPVKLYSPFTFETPPTALKPEERKNRIRQQLFTSPTNKIRDDLENLGKGINRLNLIVEKINNNNDQKQSIQKQPENIPPIITRRNIFVTKTIDIESLI